MSIYTERKFILLISSNLTLFKQRKPDLFSFRCPLCGDSEKDRTKTRGFIYRGTGQHGTKYFYKCHNCNASMSFPNFLEQVNNSLYQEFIMEKYKPVTEKEPVFVPVIKPPVFIKNVLDLQPLSEATAGSKALAYVTHRQLPQACYSRLYEALNFKDFIDALLPDHHYKIPENDHRLVIPYYDANKKLIGLQGRTLTDSKIRYITIKLYEDAPKIYGLDRVNKKEKVYVVEGPLDSEFLPNCVATMDSDLTKANEFIKKDNLVLVYDNQPRNKDIVRNVRRAIENNFTVCIWSDVSEGKDINEMVMSGIDPKTIQEGIDNHTFAALRAKLELNNWKKID